MDVYKGAIVTQVFQAIEGEGRLPVGKQITLEYMSQDHDGIFPNERSWRGFLYGNFGDGDGSYYLEGTPSGNVLKKYCYSLAQYSNLFVQHIGAGRYAAVEPEMLELKFSYDANHYNRKSDISCAVEILVMASLKEPE